MFKFEVIEASAFPQTVAAVDRLDEIIRTGKELRLLHLDLAHRAGQLVNQRGLLLDRNRGLHSSDPSKRPSLPPVKLPDSDQALMLSEMQYDFRPRSHLLGAQLTKITVAPDFDERVERYGYPGSILSGTDPLVTFFSEGRSPRTGGPHELVKIRGIDHPDLEMLRTVGVVLDWIDEATQGVHTQKVQIG